MAGFSDIVSGMFGGVGGQSPWQRLTQWNEQNPGALTALGVGLMSGNTAEGLAVASRAVDLGRQRGAMRDALIANGMAPEEAEKYAADPEAAQVRMAGMSRDRDSAFAKLLAGDIPGTMGGGEELSGSAIPSRMRLLDNTPGGLAQSAQPNVSVTGNGSMAGSDASYVPGSSTAGSGNSRKLDGLLKIRDHYVNLSMGATDERQQQMASARIGQIDKLIEAAKGETTDDLKEYQFAVGQGYKASFPDFKASMRKAGATSVNVGGEGDAFYKELDKNNAKAVTDISAAGQTARGTLTRIDRLEDLLNQAPQGGEALIKQALGEFGVNSEGLDAIQSANALIENMIPAQRPVGSGSMSDRDVEMFKRSLPRLINQPGGNAAIIRTMRGIAEYDVQRGEIADAVADRRMTAAEGRQAMRELPNPLAGLSGGVGGPTAAAVNFLRKNPGRAAEFDQKYGQGAAARFLGGQ